MAGTKVELLAGMKVVLSAWHSVGTMAAKKVMKKAEPWAALMVARWELPMAGWRAELLDLSLVGRKVALKAVRTAATTAGQRADLSAVWWAGV